MKVKTVTAPEPSPDGRWAVWTERQAVMDGEKSEMLTQVFLARTDGTGRLQLTRGEKSSEAPIFSPDSQWVFFASERAGKRNLYRIPVDGGEAEVLTSWTGTMGRFAVSPNGKWIAFAGRDADPGEEQARRQKLDFRVIDENPRNQSLWLVPVETDLHNHRPVKKAASGPWNVGAFDWSPDSRRIAYEVRPTPDADDGRKADILEVEIESGRIRPIAATAATESQPRYSPDGRTLAYVRSPQTARRIDGSRIALVNLSDLKSRDLPATPDETPNLAGWVKNRLLFSEARGTREVLYAMPVDGPPTVVFAPAHGTFGNAIALDRGGTHAGMSMQSPEEPVEAYVMDL